MKIAFLLNSSGLYGANRSLLSLLKFLREKHIKCFAIIPGKGDIEQELKKLNIDYEVAKYRACVWYPGYIGMPFLINLFNMPKIVNIIKSWDVDIIHTNNSNEDIGMIIAKILQKKHIWHIREIMEVSYKSKYIFPRFYKRLRYSSDSVICVSKYTYSYHMEKFPNPNMKMIYNPYDISFYNIERNKFTHGEEVTILTAGIFGGAKRQIDGVKAIKILLDRGITNVKLVLVGEGEKEKIDEINDYIQKFELQKYVRIERFMFDLREMREDADIALCCSEGEALPRVVVEGMLGELLSIGADSGGIAELIEDGATGLLYELGNSEHLADKIEYAISHKEEARRMIIAAKEYAVKNFNQDANNEKMLGIYQEILNK